MNNPYDCAALLRKVMSKAESLIKTLEDQGYTVLLLSEKIHYEDEIIEVVRHLSPYRQHALIPNVFKVAAEVL